MLIYVYIFLQTTFKASRLPQQIQMLEREFDRRWTGFSEEFEVSVHSFLLFLTCMCSAGFERQRAQIQTTEKDKIKQLHVFAKLISPWNFDSFITFCVSLSFRTWTGVELLGGVRKRVSGQKTDTRTGSSTWCLVSCLYRCRTIYTWGLFIKVDTYKAHQNILLLLHKCL